MKKLNVKRMLNLRSFALAGIFAFALFTVSCDKADDLPEPMFMEDNVELKKGRPETKPGAPAPGEASIATIAQAAGFTKLVDALQYVDEELNVGLVELFAEGTDQYTVFAPTDAAFNALFATAESVLSLPAGSITSVRALPANVVLAVLQYHVVEGRRAANSVVPPRGTRTIETLLGATFSVNTSKMIYAVGNTASIETPNISASNGIIHIIDTVLLPITTEQLIEILLSL